MAPIEKRFFSAKRRRHLASTGAAMRGGRYPIENKSDLIHAEELEHHSSDKKAVDAHIRARARALGLSAAINKDWQAFDRKRGAGEKTGNVAGTAVGVGAGLRAGKYVARRLATRGIKRVPRLGAGLIAAYGAYQGSKAVGQYVGRKVDEGFRRVFKRDTSREKRNKKGQWALSAALGAAPEAAGAATGIAGAIYGEHKVRQAQAHMAATARRSREAAASMRSMAEAAHAGGFHGDATSFRRQANSHDDLADMLSMEADKIGSRPKLYSILRAIRLIKGAEAITKDWAKWDQEHQGRNVAGIGAAVVGSNVGNAFAGAVGGTAAGLATEAARGYGEKLRNRENATDRGAMVRRHASASKLAREGATEGERAAGAAAAARLRTRMSSVHPSMAARIGERLAGLSTHHIGRAGAIVGGLAGAYYGAQAGWNAVHTRKGLFTSLTGVLDPNKEPGGTPAGKANQGMRQGRGRQNAGPSRFGQGPDVVKARASAHARRKVAQTFHEWGQGKLHSGSKTGPIVHSHEQAIAIALSQAGLSRK